MICANCLKDFDPHEKARIGHFDNHSVEVCTTCPCGANYYTFIEPEAWVAEESAQALIKNEQAAGRMARPKNIKSRRAVS